MERRTPALRLAYTRRSSLGFAGTNKKVHCITYDKLYDDLSTRLRIFGG